MNERIKELSEQAKVSVPPGLLVEHWIEFYNEKFAELIVRECAEQIIEKGTDWIDFNPTQTGVRPEYYNMAQHIKKHFGIE
jgi:hypothetical protein